MTRRTLSPDDAVESIEAIRCVLDRTTRYTHISWAGIVLAGCIAAAAAATGVILGVSPATRALDFLLLWGAALLVALCIGCWTTAARARSHGEPLWSRKLQVVTAGILPSLVVGLVLTVLLWDVERLDLAPGVWMGLYGLGILAVGHVLDWEFQATAWAFLLASSIALFLLRGSPHLAMLLTFGGIHLALGAFRFWKEHPWHRA